MEEVKHKHTIPFEWIDISSVLKPGKSESLKPEDRVYQRACNLCGYVIKSEGKPFDD